MILKNARIFKNQNNFLTLKLCTVQYVVPGPRVKVINLNILPESSYNELKYSPKIAFMFLSIILKFQVPDKYFAWNSKKGVSGKQHDKNVKML